MDDVYNRVARRRRRGQGGFTLIELLVVIAVLAVLAAIVIFNVTGVNKAGAQAACNTDVQTVQTAVDTFYNNNNNTYPTTVGQLVPAIIHTAPPATDGIAISATGQVTGTC
jgi:prepilin-type N-terminal cleavage/methylation domain-containing protein